MSSPSYFPRLTARDVETTSEVEESKDYGSGASVAEVDTPIQPSPTISSFPWRFDDKDIFTESSLRIRNSIRTPTGDDPWSPFSQRSFADTRDAERSGNYNRSGGSKSPVPARIPSPAHDLGHVTRRSIYPLRSKEPSPSIEEPTKLSRVIRGRKGRDTHVSSFKRGKDARGTQRTVRACASCRARRLSVTSLP